VIKIHNKKKKDNTSNYNDNSNKNSVDIPTCINCIKSLSDTLMTLDIENKNLRDENNDLKAHVAWHHKTIMKCEYKKIINNEQKITIEIKEEIPFDIEVAWSVVNSHEKMCDMYNNWGCNLSKTVQDMINHETFKLKTLIESEESIPGSILVDKIIKSGIKFHVNKETITQDIPIGINDVEKKVLNNLCNACGHDKSYHFHYHDADGSHEACKVKFCTCYRFVESDKNKK